MPVSVSVIADESYPVEAQDVSYNVALVVNVTLNYEEFYNVTMVVTTSNGTQNTSTYEMPVEFDTLQTVYAIIPNVWGAYDVEVDIMSDGIILGFDILVFLVNETTVAPILIGELLDMEIIAQQGSIGAEIAANMTTHLEEYGYAEYLTSPGGTESASLYIVAFAEYELVHIPVSYAYPILIAQYTDGSSEQVAAGSANVNGSAYVSPNLNPSKTFRSWHMIVAFSNDNMGLYIYASGGLLQLDCGVTSSTSTTVMCEMGGNNGRIGIIWANVAIPTVLGVTSGIVGSYTQKMYIVLSSLSCTVGQPINVQPDGSLRLCYQVNWWNAVNIGPYFVGKRLSYTVNPSLPVISNAYYMCYTWSHEYGPLVPMLEGYAIAYSLFALGISSFFWVPNSFQVGIEDYTCYIQYNTLWDSARFAAAILDLFDTNNDCNGGVADRGVNNFCDLNDKYPTSPYATFNIGLLNSPDNANGYRANILAYYRNSPTLMTSYNVFQYNYDVSGIITLSNTIFRCTAATMYDIVINTFNSQYPCNITAAGGYYRTVPITDTLLCVTAEPNQCSNVTTVYNYIYTTQSPINAMTDTITISSDITEPTLGITFMANSVHSATLYIIADIS